MPKSQLDALSPHGPIYFAYPGVQPLKPDISKTGSLSKLVEVSSLVETGSPAGALSPGESPEGPVVLGPAVSGSVILGSVVSDSVVSESVVSGSAISGSAPVPVRSGGRPTEISFLAPAHFRRTFSMVGARGAIGEDQLKEVCRRGSAGLHSSRCQWVTTRPTSPVTCCSRLEGPLRVPCSSHVVTATGKAVTYAGTGFGVFVVPDRD